MARTADPALRVVVGSRLFDAAPGSPFRVGLALAAGIFGLYLATGLAFGAFEDAPAWHSPEIVEKAILALLFGWALVSERLARQYTLRFLGDVGAAAGWGAERQRAAERAVFDRASTGRRGAALAGLAVGLGATWFTGPDQLGLAGYLSVVGGLHGMGWELLLNTTVCVLFAFGIQTALRLVGGATRVAREGLSIDLLDRGPWLRFTRFGVRMAALWIVGGSIVALLFVNWGFHWVTLLGFAATIGMAGSVLLVSLGSARDAIRDAKARALARVNAAIRRDSETVLGDGADPVAAARLPGLLAYRHHVEAVPDWPFDASSMLRLGLLGALALGSWLGGALVERALGLALDRP